MNKKINPIKTKPSVRKRKNYQKHKTSINETDSNIGNQ